MKKLLIFIVMAIFSLTINAQQDSTSVNITETERIIDKYSNQIATNVTQFLEAAAPAAQEGFEMVVRLQVAKGIGFLLPLIFCIIFLSLTVKEYRRLRKWCDDYNNQEEVSTYNYKHPMDDSIVTPIFIVLGIMGLLLFLLSLFTTFDGILYLVAPEWFATKEIMNLI